MRLTSTFLRTRVARRVLLLFVLCALLPILAVGIASYVQVTGHLRQQAEARLAEGSRNLGMEIIRRLLFAEAELLALSRDPAPSSAAALVSRDTAGLVLRPRFRGVALQRSDGWEHLAGDAVPPPRLDPDRAAHLAGGGSLIVLLGTGPDRVVLMGRGLAAARAPGIIWASVAGDYLWQQQEFEGESTLPEPCVLAPQGAPLFCTTGTDGLGERFTEGDVALRGTFEWDTPDGIRLASAWPIFLKARFGAPSWSLVLSEPRASVLEPIADFRRSFPLLLLLSFLVVLLASNYQIRRSMEPLAALKGGTERIADWDLETRVAVSSDDEFGDLARSFNVMARRLQRQFSALHTAGELDRAVLSTIRREGIVATVLERTPDLVTCEQVVLALVEEIGNGMATAYYQDEAAGQVADHVWLEKSDISRLAPHGESVLIAASHEEVSYLPQPLTDTGRAVRWETFPIFIKGELVSILGIGLSGGMELEPDDRLRVRQLADQVGVALVNAGLVDELEELSWGALRALARAIDAKSHWTSGHSERVAALSVAIATELGLDAAEIEVIRRGALLHDIGKIGIAGEILDKPGALTGDERRRMESHVTVGARILEPVRRFGPVIPLVVHHHERWDGTGYPSGLAGEAIPLHARIVGVADFFDALTRDRPYRQGRSTEETVRSIVEGAGTAFDPRVAEAFLAVAARDLIPASPAAS